MKLSKHQLRKPMTVNEMLREKYPPEPKYTGVVWTLIAVLFFFALFVALEVLA